MDQLELNKYMNLPRFETFCNGLRTESRFESKLYVPQTFRHYYLSSDFVLPLDLEWQVLRIAVIEHFNKMYGTPQRPTEVVEQFGEGVLGQKEHDLESQFASRAAWRVHKSALTILFCGHLRSAYSQEPERKLLGLFDAAEIPLSYFNEREMEALDDRIQTGYFQIETKTLSVYRSRVHRVYDLLHFAEGDAPCSQNYCSRSIEEELAWYHSIGGKPANLSAARIAIKKSGIRRIAELLSAEGQKKIAKLAFERLISRDTVNKSKAVFRAIWERNGISYPKIFAVQYRDPIFPWRKHSEIDGLMCKFEVVLGKKSKAALRILFGAIYSANKITDPRRASALVPSDFINALIWLEISGYSTQQLEMARSTINGLKNSVIGRSLLSQKPVKFSQFRSEIFKEIINAPFILNNFNEDEFASTFTGGKCVWHVFLERFDKLIKRFAINWNKNHRECSSKHARSEHFFILEDTITKWSFGERKMSGKRGNKPEKGILAKNEWTSPAEVRKLEELTMLAFQTYIPLRFKSEAPKIYLVKEKPYKPDEKTKSCMYWGEGRYEVFLNSEDRKSGMSYITPSSKILDKIINKYIEVMNIKFGDRLFKENSVWGAQFISDFLLSSFGHFVSFEEFLYEAKSECLSVHSCRNIFRQVIDDFYTGSPADKEYLAAIALGHKPTNLPKSGESDRYGRELRHSANTIETLWRIKNGNFEVEESKEIKALRGEIAGLKGQLTLVQSTGQKIDEATQTIEENTAATKQKLDEHLDAREKLAKIYSILKERHPEVLAEIVTLNDQKRISGR